VTHLEGGGGGDDDDDDDDDDDKSVWLVRRLFNDALSTAEVI